MSEQASRGVVAAEADSRSARLGIAWMLLATCLFVVQDGLGRILLKDYPLIEVTWARYVVHVLISTLLVAWRYPSLMASRRPVLQMVRSALLLGSTLLSLASMRIMPFVDYTAVMWVTPVLVTALSGRMLAEKVGWNG
jgi:hypothetical protein